MTLLYLLVLLLPLHNGETLDHHQIATKTMWTTANEVEIKSVLSKTSDQVFVALSLPLEASVGFEIYDKDGRVLHLWHQQKLSAGKHDLALGLPTLHQGKYILHIIVDSEIYKHLVLLP